MIDKPEATDWARWTLSAAPDTDAIVPRNVGSLLSIDVLWRTLMIAQQLPILILVERRI